MLPKFSICVLMTQSGKTFVAIDKMKKRLEEDPQSIHVVYTMNTLLNNYQFAKRLESVEEEFGQGSVLIFASKYKGEYQHVKSLEELAARELPKVVVMCSNHKRFDDGHKWVMSLTESRVHLYYDELHQYITKPLRNVLEEIHDQPHVVSMMALSATPNTIIQKRGRWRNMQLIMPESNLDNYAKSTDMEHHAIDDVIPLPYHKPRFNDFNAMDEEMIGFLETTLDENPDILQDGNRCFLPAHVRRVGHIRVRDMIFEKCPRAVVVLVNAVDKSVQFKNGEVIQSVSLISDSGSKKEVSERISEIISEYELIGRPIVVTGFLCVGMGQTLTHESYGNFTHAVLSHMNLNNDSIYQLFGRLTGRVKLWKTYIPTKLYCPTIVFNRIRVMEECARAMMEKIELTREIYQEPMLIMPQGIDVLDNARVVDGLPKVEE